MSDKTISVPVKHWEWLTETVSRMSKQLDQLTKEKKNSPLSVVKPGKWVKVSVITDLTGWDKRGMAKARANNLVEWKIENGGYLYNVDSLDQKFINKKAS